MRQSYLRPLSFGEVLDGTFSLYRANFLRLFLTALLPIIPIAIAWLAVGLIATGGPGEAPVLELAQFVMSPYHMLASTFVWGALAIHIDRSYRGAEPATLKEGYAAVFRRLPTLLGALILTFVGIVLGAVFLLIPGILVGIMCFAVVPVVMLERHGAIASLRRSRALASGAWGRIFGITLLLVIIVSIATMPVTAASLIGVVISDGQAFGGTAFALAQIGGVLGSALTTPLLVTGIVLQYYDRRVRAEGLDIELAAEQLSVAG